ncbi:C40 family peptidase [Syntrophomonas palmitatica]|uniref:C40 family peptidase n=1 Tax=Syntrophomonas palmitatica TaxID=402877 RepID=UPI0006D1D3A9|nr:NlpC/P60 family protein [Syntrophomonas palmitatica]
MARKTIAMTLALLALLLFVPAPALYAYDINTSAGASAISQTAVTFPDGTVIPIIDQTDFDNGGQQDDQVIPDNEEEEEPVVLAASSISPVADTTLVSAFRANYDNSPAQALVARAIWYMKYGYMVYGHSKYATSGYIDCSNFVSLVYKDFGYSITSAARKYNTVGRSVSGVYAKHQTGSSTKHVLVGVDKLKPGDIFTFWKEDSSGNRYIGHVAIYMGKLNGKPAIIHTVKGNPTAIGITTSFNYWYGHHLEGVRRVLPSSAYTAGASYTATGPVIPAVYKMTPGPVIMPRNLPQGF